MDNEESMFGSLSYAGAATVDVMGRGGASLVGLGSRVAPFVIGRQPPVEIGHGGMYYQPTGFIQGAAYTAGFGYSPHHATPVEYGRAVASDFGERLGLGLATTATTAAGLALGANSIMGVPMLGAPLAAVGSGLGGAIGSAFGGTGMAMGAKIGSFAGSWLAAPMLGLAVGQGLMESVTDRLVTQSMLDAESFRFVGAGSSMASPRLGAGMSRKARQEAAEFARELDIESEFFGDEDVRQILQEGMRKGLFVGAGEMDTFKRRFKEITDNVKDIMKLMNVSLDEGINVISELRQYGVDPGRARDIAALADASGKVAGRTATEMLSFGMQGASQFVGTGISPDIGMQANMANLATVRAARDAGWISQQALVHLGGETGAAQFLTASGIGYAQSSLGRGFTAAYYDAERGGFDVRQFSQDIQKGTAFDLTNMAQRAGERLADPANLIRYQAKQEEIITELGKAFGGQGLQIANMVAAGGLAQNLMNLLPNLEGGDAYKYVLKTAYGYSDAQANLVIGEMQGRVDAFATKQTGAEKTKARMEAEAGQERNPLYQIYEKTKDVAAGLFDDLGGRAMTRQVNNLTESITRYYEKTRGIITYDTTSLDVKGMALATDDLVRARDLNATPGVVVNLDDAGSFFGFGRSIGEELGGYLKKGVFGKAGEELADTVSLNLEELRKNAASQKTSYTDEQLIEMELQRQGYGGGVILDITRPLSDVSKTSKTSIQQLSRMMSASRDTTKEQDRIVHVLSRRNADMLTKHMAGILSMGLPEARAMQEAGKLKGAFGGAPAEELIGEAILSGRITGRESSAEVLEKITAAKTNQVVGGFLDSKEAQSRDVDTILTNAANNEDLRRHFGREGLQRAIEHIKTVDVPARGLTPEITRTRLREILVKSPLTATSEEYAATLLGMEAYGIESMAEKTREAATFAESSRRGKLALTVNRYFEEVEKQTERLEDVVGNRAEIMGAVLPGGFEFRQGVVEALTFSRGYQQDYDRLGVELKRLQNIAAGQSGDQRAETEAMITRTKLTRDDLSQQSKKQQDLAVKLQVRGREGKDRERGLVEARAMIDVITEPTLKEQQSMEDIFSKMGVSLQGISAAQQEIATEEIGAAALMSLRYKEGYTKQEMEKMLQPLAGVTTVKGILGMDVKKFKESPLGATDVGKIILQHRESLETIQEATKYGASEGPRRIRGVLKEAGVSQDKIAGLTEQIMSPAERMRGLEEFTKVSVVGSFEKEKMITAIGGVKDLEKQTGKDFLATQTQVNAQVVLTLQALAKRFGL